MAEQPEERTDVFAPEGLVPRAWRAPTGFAPGRRPGGSERTGVPPAHPAHPEDQGHPGDRAHPGDWGHPPYATNPVHPANPVHRRRRLVVVLVVLVGAGVGGYAGHQVATGHLRAALGAPRAGGTPGSGPSASTTVSAAPTGTGAPVVTGTGTGVVQVAPALADHPETAEVRFLLDRYFTAVNRRDYPAYRATLVPGPRLKSEAQFRADFASTQDSAIRLLNLRDDGAGGLVAAVDFVSRQAPDAAPDGATCLHWVISYRLVRLAGALRIDVVPNREPDSRPC